MFNRVFWLELALQMSIAFAVFFGTEFVGSDVVTDWRAWLLTTAIGSAKAATSVMVAGLVRLRGS